MRAIIENFRGCERAEIELAPLALVAGHNGAGKSSIAMAVAAALCGEPVPVKGVKKGEAGALVRTGSAKGRVIVESGNGSVAVAYPAAKASAKGHAPYASAFAVGLNSLADMDQKASALALNQLLDATPSGCDIEVALNGVDSPIVNRIQQSINDHGWDETYKSEKDRGAEFKGAWRAVTGENYGSAKAETWEPDGWTLALEGHSEDGLCSALHDARGRLERAIAASAVNASERDQLQEQVEQRERAEARRGELQAQLDELVAALTAERDRLDALPAPTTENNNTPCPHCGGALTLRGRSIVAAESASDAENKRRAEAIRQQEAVVAKAKERVDDTHAELQAVRETLRRCEEAAEKLAAAAEPAGAESVEDARAAVERAERELEAWKAKRDADHYHEQVQQQARIVKMLAPDGLRLTKLREAVAAFNERLEHLCIVAGWPSVALDDELAITLDGRPFGLLSLSEQWRCRVILQVAIALDDDSEALVIDAADILDRPGRNGLMKLVRHCGLPTLLCMTASNDNEVPNLREKNAGATYWIESGNAREVTA